MSYRVKKATVLEAIRGTGGIVSQIAKRLSVDWSTARKYINAWDETKKAFEDERETILDMAERTLFKSVKDGNSQDAKWVLSTLGKNRGFSERQEITGANGDNFINKVVVQFVRPEDETTATE